MNKYCIVKETVCSDLHLNILTVFTNLQIEMVIPVSHFYSRH